MRKTNDVVREIVDWLRRCAEETDPLVGRFVQHNAAAKKVGFAIANEIERRYIEMDE